MDIHSVQLNSERTAENIGSKGGAKKLMSLLSTCVCVCVCMCMSRIYSCVKTVRARSDSGAV